MKKLGFKPTPGVVIVEYSKDHEATNIEALPSPEEAYRKTGKPALYDGKKEIEMPKIEIFKGEALEKEEKDNLPYTIAAVPEDIKFVKVGDKVMIKSGVQFDLFDFEGKTYGIIPPRAIFIILE
jgi:hypothetical protein